MLAMSPDFELPPGRVALPEKISVTVVKGPEFDSVRNRKPKASTTGLPPSSKRAANGANELSGISITFRNLREYLSADAKSFVSLNAFKKRMHSERK
jgi:hypothetical protein